MVLSSQDDVLKEQSSPAMQGIPLRILDDGRLEPVRVIRPSLQLNLDSLY